MHYGIAFTKNLAETRCLGRPHKIIPPSFWIKAFHRERAYDALTCCLGRRFARFWNRASISHSLCSVLLQAFRADEWELFLRGPGTEGSTGGESERTDQKRARERDPARQQCSVTIRESFSCDDFGIDSEIRTSHQLNTWPQKRETFPGQFWALPCCRGLPEHQSVLFSFFSRPHPLTPDMLSSRSQFPGAAIPVIMCAWRLVPGASGLDAWRGRQPKGEEIGAQVGTWLWMDEWEGGRHRGGRVLDPPLRAALTGADRLNLLFLLTPDTHFHS